MLPVPVVDLRALLPPEAGASTSNSVAGDLESLQRKLGDVSKSAPLTAKVRHPVACSDEAPDGRAGAEQTCKGPGIRPRALSDPVHSAPVGNGAPVDFRTRISNRTGA